MESALLQVMQATENPAISVKWSGRKNAYSVSFNRDHIGDFATKGEVVVYLIEAIGCVNCDYCGKDKSDNLEEYEHYIFGIKHLSEMGQHKLQRKYLEAFKKQLLEDGGKFTNGVLYQLKV